MSLPAPNKTYDLTSAYLNAVRDNLKTRPDGKEYLKFLVAEGIIKSQEGDSTDDSQTRVVLHPRLREV